VSKLGSIIPFSILIPLENQAGRIRARDRAERQYRNTANSDFEDRALFFRCIPTRGTFEKRKVPTSLARGVANSANLNFLGSAIFFVSRCRALVMSNGE
jgi:hypothetical protein